MNLFEFLLANGKPDDLAVIASGATTTYAELKALSEAIAASLLAHGTKKQDRVGILADNSVFWIASYLGIIKIGAIATPFPARLTPDELRGFIRLTECKAFCSEASKLRKHGAEIPNGSCIVMPEKGIEDKIAQRFSVLAPSGTCPTAAADEKKDLAALMFTSGSTGQPNAVKVSHRNVMANTESILSYLRLNSDDKMMAVLPFHYCFGTSLLHTHLRAGGTVVLSSSPQFVESVLNDLGRFGCTGIAGVPAFFQNLIRNSSFPRRQFPCLRQIQQAGGKLPDVFVKELISILPPPTQLFVMYGQTEATARLSYLPPERLSDKLGSIGRGMTGVRLQVLDEAGNPVAPGQVGEIVAEGDSVTLGYWAPDPSKNPFRGNRLYTGDHATVDEDGFIYIVGRADDFIKPSGFRISATQIENALLEIPGILEVAVIGVPHPQLGEAVKAFIVARQGEDLTEECLLDHCRRKLPAYAVPRQVEFLSALPKNGAGKISKKVLKEAALPIDHPICVG